MFNNKDLKNNSNFLLYFFTFFYIWGLVIVAAVGVGDVIRKELQRDGRDDRGKKLFGPRNRNEVVRVALDGGVPFGGYHDAGTFARPDLFDVRDDLLVDR